MHSFLHALTVLLSGLLWGIAEVKEDALDLLTHLATTTVQEMRAKNASMARTEKPNENESFAR